MNWHNLSADAIWKHRHPLKRERQTSDVEPSTDSGISSRANSHSDWCASPGLARPTRHGSVIEVEETPPSASQERKVALINDLKKEKTYLTQEDLLTKTVAVEKCIMDGLRKRFLGLLGQRTSLALLHSIARGFPPAELVLSKTAEVSSSPMRRVYDEEALMADRAKGGMPAALLLGPCAISFKRLSADSSTSASDRVLESVACMQPLSSSGQTSSLSSQMHASSSSPSNRPRLSVKRQGSSLASLERSSTSRDYVFSLHANFRTTLLYGKNNVSTAPVEGDLGEESRGYLSLHKTLTGDVTLRWTPNVLMHACSQPSSASVKDNTNFTWKQAMTIEMSQIIYIHLHQKDENTQSAITFVSAEGGQSPPLFFTTGQQSIVFLSALETGLAPMYQLDPPLSHGSSIEKSLPRIRRRTSVGASTAHDYVFRIVRIQGKAAQATAVEDAVDVEPSPSESPSYACVSLPNSPAILNSVDSLVNAHVGLACRSMQQQILTRAFLGWLSYCRHVHTVRDHLLGLIHKNNVLINEHLEPVDQRFWQECRSSRTQILYEEFLRRVYWQGMEEGDETNTLRRQCWPYLLGVFEWHESPEPKTTGLTEHYRQDVEEWRVLEAEVRRRDEEAFNLARARKGATPIREMSMASDVFDDEDEEIENGAECEEKLLAKENELLIERFGANLHRIEKDVERCDRALRFYSNPQNLESLRRVVCTYVRRNLEDGYVQGMCDIAAPLLVIFEDEALTLECYTVLMRRMKENFPHHAGMDRCLSNLRSLVQIIDPQIFSLLSGSADFTQLYFSYRWFLLDFKRELSYDGVYRVWETIWSCAQLESSHFQLFFALAMLTNYRDAILENSMDFADLIKFFNDMTGRHDVIRLLSAARAHLRSLHTIVQNID